MWECLIIVYVLLLFVFPVPGLILALGACASYLGFKKYMLLRDQPAAGKTVVWLALLAQGVNLVLSLALGLVLAFAVKTVIIDFQPLFYFNFLFCSLISWRWFDFSHQPFKHFIFRDPGSKLNSLPENGATKTFVVIIGLREATGWNKGGIPAWMDAGMLTQEKTGLKFEGLFSRMELTPSAIKQAAPLSHEKIHVTLHSPLGPHPTLELRLILRDRFYPFKSRKLRDRILAAITGERPLAKIPGAGIALSAPGGSPKKFEPNSKIFARREQAAPTASGGQAAG